MIMVSHPRSTHYQAQPRDPQFQHLDHHSAPSTPSPPFNYAMPSFAPQQQPTSIRSTPTSYPSPASYPSPSMSAYTYPQQGHHSPHFQSMNGSNYSLPPIRMTPPNATLPPPLLQQQSGSPLLPPPQMFYGHGHAHGLAVASPMSHITSSPQPLRYALPQVTPERVMSGGRHKKEIKRRTKTGCLTCRKRRIKCDEAHPTCKNCQKSKRECMGYDPIFKTQPGPAAIQPAPSSGGPTAMPSSTSLSYGIPNTAVGSIVYAPTISTAGSSPASSCEPYNEYPVDPSLEATAPIPIISGPMTMLAENPVSYRPDLKRTYDRASPLSCVSDTPRPSITPMRRSVTPSQSMIRDNSTNQAKRIKIDDLLTGASNGLPLTPPSGDQSSQALPMTSPIYLYNRYASMLDTVLETGWFATRGLEKVSRGEQFGEQLGRLFKRLQSRSGIYAEEDDRNLGIYGGDAEVLLNSLKLVYGTQVPTGDIHLTEQEDDYVTVSDMANRKETINRIAVVEALVTGRTRAIDLCSPLVSPKSSPPQFRSEIAESSAFWRSLARFVSLQEGRDSEQEFDAVLRDMRSNTGRQNTREILCTIAEARHHNNRLQLHHSNGSETEDKRKLRGIFERAKDNILRVSSLPNGSVDQAIRRISARATMLWGYTISDNILL